MQYYSQFELALVTPAFKSKRSFLG